MVHKSAIGLHVPLISPAPHLAESANEQNCFSGQRMPARPPHILPAGGADDAEPAGAGADEDVAGVGAGTELTTPLGLSTGIALALALGAGGVVATAVAVGSGAVAGGVGCAEQLASTVKDRNATHCWTRFDWVMWAVM
jgi:hypothetical protein